MTERLKQAFEEALRVLLPEEQDEFANQISSLLAADDDARWNAAFEESRDKLDRLANRALEDYRASRTKPFDPEKL